jgi:hypothetical protein
MVTASRFSLLLCNDCCCGTERKHPGFDHVAQRRELEIAVSQAGGKLHVVKCLDACSYSNVAVIRHASGERVWIGGLATTTIHLELCHHIADGVDQPMSRSLKEHVFTPTRESQDVESSCRVGGIRVNESR